MRDHPLTQRAINESTNLKLPTARMGNTQDTDWIKAFAWFNRNFRDKYPVSMNCRPCWESVYTTLKRAKQAPRMKIVYIAHPIGGDVAENLAALRIITRNLNRLQPDIVPFVPYYLDCVCLDDDIPADRAKGIANDMELFNRGFIDELWLFGNRISAGMKAEILKAQEMKIPIFAQTEGTRQELSEMNKKEHLQQ